LRIFRSRSDQPRRGSASDTTMSDIFCFAGWRMATPSSRAPRLVRA
jgi:hypothetical protein